MGKNPGYLPASVMTVGAMIDAQDPISWHCEGCGAYGPVNLQRIAEAKGFDYSLVDRRAPCQAPGCGGMVYFRYGSPSRRLEALRERQDATKAAAAWDEMERAWNAYNTVARRHRFPTLERFSWLKR